MRMVPILRGVGYTAQDVRGGGRDTSLALGMTDPRCARIEMTKPNCQLLETAKARKGSVSDQFRASISSIADFEGKHATRKSRVASEIRNLGV
jgi:hypothetical protein